MGVETRTLSSPSNTVFREDSVEEEKNPELQKDPSCMTTRGSEGPRESHQHLQYFNTPSATAQNALGIGALHSTIGIREGGVVLQKEMHNA